MASHGWSIPSCSNIDCLRFLPQLVITSSQVSRVSHQSQSVATVFIVNTHSLERSPWHGWHSLQCLTDSPACHNIDNSGMTLASWRARKGFLHLIKFKTTRNLPSDMQTSLSLSGKNQLNIPLSTEAWNLKNGISRQMICSKQILTRDLSEANASRPGKLISVLFRNVFLSEKIMKPINK